MVKIYDNTGWRLSIGNDWTIVFQNLKNSFSLDISNIAIRTRIRKFIY